MRTHFYITILALANVVVAAQAGDAERGTPGLIEQDRVKEGRVDSHHFALERVEFNRDVRPILSDACFACHGPDEGSRESGLRLDTEEGAATELESGDGRAVVPGDLEKSQLWQRVISKDPDLRMPVGGDPLPPQQLDILQRWIEQGARWQQHWSYVRPKRPPVPAREPTKTKRDQETQWVSADAKSAHQRQATAPSEWDDNWGDNAIDLFVLGGLRDSPHDLHPSPPADRVTLVRRLSLDLLGLPPSFDEVERFRNDDSIGAYERLVDRLLASPHYGERMAAYWLDLVRFADTVGYHGDQVHSISPYRDYVINAFNANMPFDQFTIEQLAGDLLPNATVWQRVASGYNRLLQTTHEGGAQDAEYLAKYAADRVRTTSSVWLGATMGCCECHDHKFDPYTIKDFYQFAAFFADLKEHGAYPAPNSNPTKRVPEMLVLEAADQQALTEVERELAHATSRLNSDADADADAQELQQTAIQEEVQQLTAKRDAIRARGRLTMVSESTTPRTMRVLDRGDWMDTTSPIAKPAIPAFLGHLPQGDAATRLDLARWLVSPENPLTARVVVNRLWQLLTGIGLSKVTDDLGSQGEWPVNPDLLDWMAIEFMESGWDVKHVVRLIVTSTAYRQRSTETDLLRAADPQNRLMARQSRFRVDAEAIRDGALAVSGLLVDDLGGRSVKPYQPAGYYAHLNFPERTYQHDTGAQQYRRGVYMHWQRQFLHPMLKAFDAPSREECTARRPRSNTPLAALALLNDPSFIEAARGFAERIVAADFADDESRIRWAFRQILSRPPTDRETALLATMLDEQRRDYREAPAAAKSLVTVGLKPTSDNVDLVELAAWTTVARALMNTNEAIMRN